MKERIKEVVIIAICFIIAVILCLSCVFGMGQQATATNMDKNFITTEAPTTEAPTEPTKVYSIEDILLSFSYKELNIQEEIQKEIELINNYIITLQEAKIDVNYQEFSEEIDIEITEMNKILEQYNTDYKKWSYQIKDVPKAYHTANRCKSWMNYTAITAKSSRQYKLQHKYAYTGTYGIRMVDERYCIAVGSYFTTKIGQYMDIVLANGTVIPCILGDCKANAHTDKLNIAHMSDGSVVEFVVDQSKFIRKPRRSGDASDCCPEWDSPVVQIKIYNYNVFE